MFSNDAVLMPARHLNKQSKMGSSRRFTHLYFWLSRAKKDRHQEIITEIVIRILVHILHINSVTPTLATRHTLDASR